ncbi:sensor histidine kinase [Chryseolinea lacunae]|uniref:histidine kinase n=1 Tax=Chryseolinea lacunae TaxID=2801331 RepID=A0ABS1L205_9BACT|nr:HAMP domain-containing sensor histidine kinase [Chryseolinea lacunae]MBL0745739.1 HAMP domain-containing histidine kinase [Chryseolinea lacunae]
MQRISTILGFSEVALQKLFNLLPIPFLISDWRDHERQNLFVNTAFIEEIGYSCHDIPTLRDWFLKAYPDEGYRNKVIAEWTELSRAGQQHAKAVMNACICTRTKGEQWYEVASYIGESLNMVAFTNINKEVTRENELAQMNENKNRVLSILSHDLRSPLTNLQSLIELSVSGVLTPDEYHQCMKSVSTSTFNLVEVLDTTLQWTRTNFDNINPTIVAANLSEVIGKIAGQYEKSFQDKGITLKLSLGVENVTTDPDIISIVLRNVLSNAVKFTNAGGVTVSTFRNGKNTCIAVKDSGTGMTPAQIRAVLDGQSKSTEGTQNEKGAGLGLRLSKDLLTKINAHFEIESALGRGTTVDIVFTT